MVNYKLIAIIGTANKRFPSIIDSYAKVFANSRSELRMKLKEFYKNTVWSEVDDDIAVFPVITEDNGYQHCGKELFRVKSSRFWNK